MSNEDLEKRRVARLREFAIDQAMARFRRGLPGLSAPTRSWPRSAPTKKKATSATCSSKMPAAIDGKPYTTFVVVDGGDDRTAEIARSFPGVKVIEFPVNFGHGVALQVTYRYCIDHGVKYIVTLDADGQNDPAEIPQILKPLLADQADFVVASRVLGEDKTTDVVPQDRRALFLVRHEPHDRRAPHRHLHRLPGAASHDVGRRRRPTHPRAVPNRRTY